MKSKMCVTNSRYLFSRKWHSEQIKANQAFQAHILRNTFSSTIVDFWRINVSVTVTGVTKLSPHTSSSTESILELSPFIQSSSGWGDRQNSMAILAEVHMEKPCCVPSGRKSYFEDPAEEVLSLMAEWRHMSKRRQQQEISRKPLEDVLYKTKSRIL